MAEIVDFDEDWDDWDDDEPDWDAPYLATGVFGGLPPATVALAYATIGVGGLGVLLAASVVLSFAVSILADISVPFFVPLPYLVPVAVVITVFMFAVGRKHRSLARLRSEELLSEALGGVLERPSTPAAVVNAAVRVMRSHATEQISGPVRYPKSLVIQIPSDEWEVQREWLLKPRAGQQIGKQIAKKVAIADQVRGVRPPQVQFEENPALWGWFAVGCDDYANSKSVWAEVFASPEPGRPAPEPTRPGAVTEFGLQFEGGTFWVRRLTEVGRAVTGGGRIEGDSTVSRVHATVAPANDGLVVTPLTEAITKVNTSRVKDPTLARAGDKVTFGRVEARVVTSTPEVSAALGATMVWPETVVDDAPTVPVPGVHAAGVERGDEGLVPEGGTTGWRVESISGPDLEAIHETLLATWFNSDWAGLPDQRIANLLAIPVHAVTKARDIAKAIFIRGEDAPVTDVIESYKVARSLPVTITG